MEQKKIKVSQGQKSEDKKPKYIANLLKSAAMRKREQERRIERGVQREREKEGDEFADKESFVTSAYRQKMLEQAEEEEKLKKQDELDALHDVTKQKDLSQFYRNLLNRNVAMGAKAEQSESQESNDKKEYEIIDRSKTTQKSANQKSKETDEELKRKRLSKERALNETDVEIQLLSSAGSLKRSKQSTVSDNSTASEPEEVDDREMRTKSHAIKRNREKDKSLNTRTYRDINDSNRQNSKRALSSQLSDSEDKSKETFYSDRNQHRKRETSSERSKVGDSNVGKNKKDKRRKEPTVFRRNRKDSDPRRSYCGNSSSEHEEDRTNISLKQKSRRSDRSYDDRDVHSNSENRKYRRRKSEDESEGYHRKEKRRTSEYSADKYVKEKEKSSRHSRKKPKKDDEIGRQHEGDIERKKGAEKMEEEKKTESFEKERLKIFERHNDAESISSAKERYLARKRGVIAPQTHDDDSDD